MARAWADVSLDAIAANVETLRSVCAPAEVCAVVKADGYGHGAVPVARAAVEGGAAWLAVAQVAEADGAAGGRRRRADPAAVRAAASATSTTALAAGVADHRLHRAAHPAARRRPRAPAGCRCPSTSRSTPGCTASAPRPRRSSRLAELVHAEPLLSLDALWTHCAVADEPDDPFTALQLERFDAAVAAIERVGHPGADAPRRQLRRRHRPPREPLRPRALRHRRLRHRPGPGARRPARPRAGGAPRHGGGLREAARRRRAGVLRPPARRRARHHGRHASRSATPTGCSGGSGWRARTC